MRDVARCPNHARRDLFQETAAEMGVHPAIAEKDFWVCWILDYLFTECAWKDRLAFKGGTSLCKAFGLIERFSEDIDLVLDWRVLGYSEDEPTADRSATQHGPRSEAPPSPPSAPARITRASDGPAGQPKPPETPRTRDRSGGRGSGRTHRLRPPCAGPVPG
ncbi:MAG: nucleotidyl transferase AbiEii/AbiGii toxin family protein [Candidatus Hydrogenedentes bacterium]|nr:nucleotidyl transferase AbiEii/AbiGii toxin family protein [Candidatus Hydrogenedentota bacterium]